MKFFLDSAIIEELKEASSWGIIDGVTTNPSLVAKSGKSISTLAEEITSIIDGPISLEVLSTTANEMIAEGKKLADYHDNIVVKCPMTIDGLKATNALAMEGIPVNVTLIFSANQALLAAKAGAAYVSPFIGRLDDISYNGMDLIQDINTIFENYDFETEILAASIRHPTHVLECALAGADVGTLPLKVMKQLFNHPLTNIGLDKFLQDAKNIPT